jgi:hypothetical protein
VTGATSSRRIVSPTLDGGSLANVEKRWESATTDPVVVVVDLLGRYSNPDIVSRFKRILSGQGRDRPSRRRAGLPTHSRILSDNDIAIARKMYDTGQSLAMIGEHFGVAQRTVLNAFHRAGVLTRGPGPTSEPETFPVAITS